jgi:hypothetical protein
VSESTAGSNMDISKYIKDNKDDGTTANRKSGLEDKDKDNKDKKDN